MKKKGRKAVSVDVAHARAKAAQKAADKVVRSLLSEKWKLERELERLIKAHDRKVDALDRRIVQAEKVADAAFDRACLFLRDGGWSAALIKLAKAHLNTHKVKGFSAGGKATTEDAAELLNSGWRPKSAGRAPRGGKRGGGR